jgi:hypothetical protein
VVRPGAAWCGCKDEILVSNWPLTSLASFPTARPTGLETKLIHADHLNPEFCDVRKVSVKSPFDLQLGEDYPKHEFIEPHAVKR